jgi:purine-cytosine permease-like protein
MMLPYLLPTLWRYRQALGKTGDMLLSWLTALAGIGYFVVWTVVGIVVFPLGATEQRSY